MPATLKNSMSLEEKKNQRMGFQFNLALHVYLILDCLDQGLNNLKQKYYVR